MSIEAYWSARVRDFLAQTPRHIAGQLAYAAQQRFRQNEATQLRAWTEQCVVLAAALSEIPSADGWQLLFEVTLPRLGRRADAVLLAAGTIIVLEFKVGADRADRAGREQAEDFALDLQDFHAGSRGRHIVPIVVPTRATAAGAQAGLALPGVAPVRDATPATLAAVLADCTAGQGGRIIDPEAWCNAPYRPVPPIIEAACALYARHDVEDILDARAGATSLAMTSAAIAEAVAWAKAESRHVVLFVTGVPGAGKTLCGLNACFGAAEVDQRATFLTGNPSLVHVLREALARDAASRDMNLRAARQRMEGVIQQLPRFRNYYVSHSHPPAERVVVIDEAQRSWSRDHAIRKTRDKPPHLSDSEPGHLLEAMARHTDWSAVICLVGNGQEIHDGEGGLAEWGVALAQSPTPWSVLAAPDCLTAIDARRRLPHLPGLRTDERLHLSVPTRQIGHPAASDWVDAVLEGDRTRAASIAAAESGGLPYFLTRDLDALRTHLRLFARGSRRAGLVASSGARRLRAEGLGAELPHMDAGAVARWFLDRWPDVRASDSLELLATEFSAQGLELDVVGLCWDADLMRHPAQHAWHVRAFRGTGWQNTGSPEAIANRINTYRVLLTRARHETIIWVPRGDAADATRTPAIYDAIAAMLAACGTRTLGPAIPTEPQPAPDLFAHA